MTLEIFEQDVKSRLQEAIRQKPAMRQEDAVKFVFQAMLGVGHLLSSRKSAEAFVAREMEAQSADQAEPLFERLSPAWCRLNLRPAKALGLPPEVIAGMMLASGGALSFTRQDVADFCRQLTLPGEGGGAVDAIPDEAWIPSHSSAYREQYRPAYRVLSADWIPCIEAVRVIAEKEAAGKRLLVTLDGPCASGKTTLARNLAAVFRGQVVHTDDYVIPHRQKTPERLAVPGGNCDAERLAREVAVPFAQGFPVRYRRYDCRKDTLLPEEQLTETRVLILEGSYCNLPVLRACADVRLFLTAPWETREARLRVRESPASMQQFLDRWIPLENTYFEAFHLPDDGTILITGGGA